MADCGRLWVLHARAHHGALSPPHRCAALAQEMSREVHARAHHGALSPPTGARRSHRR